MANYKPNKNWGVVLNYPASVQTKAPDVFASQRLEDYLDASTWPAGYHLEEKVYFEMCLTAVLQWLDDRGAYWALIVHDRDILPSGKPKTHHIHMLIALDNAMKKPDLLALFQEMGFPLNCVSVDVCKSQRGLLRYLIHADDPNKIPYKPSDVIDSSILAGGDGAPILKEALNSRYVKPRTYEALFALLDGVENPRDLVRVLDPDYLASNISLIRNYYSLINL